MAYRSSATFRNGRRFVLLALALVAFYVVIPQIGSFQDTLPLLLQAQARDILPALGCVLATYVAGAGTYYWLAMHPLPYGRTLLIQVAGMFVNRLLPAGIGSIGVNYAYLRKVRHTKTEAASVVAVNNALGLVGHTLLLIVLLTIYGQTLPPLRLELAPDFTVIAGITMVALILWALFYKFYGRRLVRAARDFGLQLFAYHQRLKRLTAALGCSLCLTLANASVLWFCVTAMNGELSFMAIFLVFTFGVALGTATPTPGGLGGIEAGLVAGLVVYHVDEATALAIVLLYRLLTYWLPLLAGSMAFVYSQRRRYI